MSLTLESPPSSDSWLLDSLSLLGDLVSRLLLSLSLFLSFLSRDLLLFLSRSRDRDRFRLRSRSLLRDRDLRRFSLLSGLREELRLCLSLAMIVSNLWKPWIKVFLFSNVYTHFKISLFYKFTDRVTAIGGVRAGHNHSKVPRHWIWKSSFAWTPLSIVILGNISSLYGGCLSQIFNLMWTLAIKIEKNQWLPDIATGTSWFVSSDQRTHSWHRHRNYGS